MALAKKDAVSNFENYQEFIVSELTGLSKEIIEDMDIVEVNKILTFITSRFKMFGFDEIKN